MVEDDSVIAAGSIKGEGGGVEGKDAFLLLRQGAEDSMQKRQGAKSRGDSGAETSMGKKEQKYGIHTARGGHKVRTLREVDILAG